MTKYSVDRIEGDYAVLEGDGRQFSEVLLSLLPKGVREGDILVCGESGGFSIDTDSTNHNKKTAFERFRKNIKK